MVDVSSTEPQESLWQSEFLITPRKAKLMRRSWAEVFRNEALVLIEEERFAPMYSPDMGRPNRAVQTVLGVLVLKEMFDLTDMEALEELEFNLLWHHALRLEMEEAHLAQKTLHNFRVRLMEHDGGRLAFSETTDRMIEALGLRTGKQRLDSTHVMSNIALLTRLGPVGLRSEKRPQSCSRLRPGHRLTASPPVARIGPSSSPKNTWWTRLQSSLDYTRHRDLYLAHSSMG